MKGQYTDISNGQRQQGILNTAIALVVGLAVLDLWCDVLGHSAGMGASADIIQTAYTNGRVFWNLSLVVFCAIAMVFPAQIERFKRVGDVAACLLASIGTALFAFSGSGSTVSAELGVLTILLTAICYGWIEIRLLAETIRIENFAMVAGIIAASRIVKTLAVPLVGIASHIIQIGIDIALPVLALAALMWLSHNYQDSIVQAAETSRITVDETGQIAVMALLVLCPIANAVARAISNLGFWGGQNLIDGSSLFTAIFASLLFCIMVIATFARCSNSSDIIDRFIRAIVLLMGFLLLFGGRNLDDVGIPELATSLLSTATELFSHFLFWLSAAAAIRMVDRHPYRLAAITELAMSLLAIVLSLVLQSLQGAGEIIVEALLYLLMVAALSFVWRIQVPIESTPISVDFDEACMRLAAQYNLTPRETEVFCLLAKGRSRTFIQSELILSDSTIKTYTNHIYQKLGIHNKQDLISLVQTDR